jgi:mono/diheme cytochrome c family protein
MRADSCILSLLGGLLLAGSAQADVAFFEQKVRPVLVEHCYSCHSTQAKKLKGNLYLDTKAGWQKGGDSGEPAIIPGKPEESLLIRSIQHLEADLEMPPKKPKLPDAVIADLVTWVKMGAPDPREGKVEAKRADKSWWSLQPLRKEFAHQSIDGFIEEKLKEKGLQFSPQADARTLVRRMTYDLHGLPPSMESVGQESQESHAKLVDKLLSSPRYGEQWGRHWLDVIRFGESNGFERNFVIDDLWPFRDYVIKSINDDKPFNQFITEHLAGDVIGKDDPAVEVGSAFLVAGPYDDVGNADPVAQKNIRAATLDDMITATGSAFLGLTVNCARCHHHKFDPIPTEDYYRIRAAFEGVTHGRRVVATKEARDAHAAATKPLNLEVRRLETERLKLDGTINDRAHDEAKKVKPTRPKIDENGTDESFQPTQARYLKFVIHSLTSDRQPGKPARSGGSGGKLTEFQVWSTKGENVALASHGTKAEGAKAATADDFPEAYGPQYCIDGQKGEAWFIGSPAELRLTFAQPEMIQRITFINARGDRDVDESRVRGATPCEYDVQVSMDGKTWTTVATDEGREPWTKEHGIAKARRSVITKEETAQLADFDRQIAATKAALAKIAPLPQIWAGLFSQPTVRTFVHQGGDPTKELEPVVPASLNVLDKITQPFSLPPEAEEGQRRLALARWITSDDNALTARVLANRVWHYHFGTGLVDTPSDFGYLGSQPTHPELLDYLATRLIQNGWKIKELHREIMMSRTYQQASIGNMEGLKLDKSARLLWRFPPRRLSAEEIRDTMLTAAGQMKLEPMGGAGFRLYKFSQNNVCTYFPLDQHGPETYRRAVYHQNARASVVDVLNDFDLPDIAFASPKRANTTTPLQALTLLNHSFTLDMAAALAARGGDWKTDTGAAIIRTYRHCFQREPSAKEMAMAAEFLHTQPPTALCRALLNSNELIYLE